MLNWLPKALLLTLLTITSATATVLPGEVRLVGEGKFKVLFWDVFHAQLFISTRTPLEEVIGPVVLKLTYLRDFKKEQLIDATRKQLEETVSESSLEDNLEEPKQLWPDIVKSDSISFYLDNNFAGHFYHNEQYLGSLADRDFNQAFIYIWLSTDGQYADLAKQLRAIK